MENITEETKQKSILLTERSILGNIAKWATMQSPYHRPDNLELVLDKMYELIKDDFDENKKYCMKFDTYKQAHDYIAQKLHSIPEFVKWNDRKNGRDGNGFTSAGHHDNGDITLTYAKADNDFIDLDALTRNVTNDALND